MLPCYTTLWWARIFIILSSFSLFMNLLPSNFKETYTNTLLGFSLFYIIAVQHATITFPRNKGGIFRISADLSVLLMVIGFILKIFLVFGLGFLLFLLFQLLPLMVYRAKIPRKNYDKLSVAFMFIAFISGTASMFINSWKGFIHAIFLGVELNMFLGCMAWMLPRFSKRIDDVATYTFISVPSSILALGFNLFAFITGHYIFLKFASIFMIAAILVFWVSFYKKFFSFLLHLGFAYFTVGFTFAFLLNPLWHPLFVLTSMCVFTVVMGSKWVPLIAGGVPQKPDMLFYLSFLFLIIYPFAHFGIKVFSALFGIWILKETLMRKQVITEMKKSAIYFILHR